MRGFKVAVSLRRDDGRPWAVDQTTPRGSSDGMNSCAAALSGDARCGGGSARRLERATLLRFIAFLSILISAASVFACKVPVFRYALERWNPDEYRFVIVTDSEPDADLREIIQPTQNIAFLNSNAITDPAVKSAWQKHGKSGQALLVAKYPEKSSVPEGQVASVVDFSKDHFARVQSSPVREEVGRRLGQGHSAVWLFLESGDATKDARALTVLEDQIRKDADWIKLPSAEEMEVKPDVLLATKIRLRVEFSIIPVKRSDPREAFLVDCLLNSESDLRDFNEPMAFPVFGRGRVLYALIGEGISADTIRKASSFIAGPCSCQVKEQNPGFDLLLSADWPTLVGDTLISTPIPGTTTTSSEPKLLKIPAGRGTK